MKLIVILMLFASIANAIPSCINYPYKDFSWSDSYSTPLKESELIQKCLQINSNSPELCTAIQNNSLSDEEKKSFILTGFKNSNYFEQTTEWNNQITFAKTSPSNVQVTNGNYIKDAWITITSINSAISKDNVTYVNSSGTINFEYNFSFVVPKESFPNDCNTKYEICGYDYNVQTTNNGQNLANTRNSFEFNASETNNFLVTLNIQSQYLIHHYKRRLICNGRNCRAICNYASTEDRRDFVSLTDRKQADYQEFNYTTKVFIDKFNGQTAEGWLLVNSTSDLKSITLEFPTSKLQINRFNYYFNYSLAPYDVLNIESKAVNQIEASKLSILENKIENNSHLIHFLAKTNNLTGKLTIESQFNEYNFDNICIYNATQKPILHLNTSELNNSTFEVQVNFYDNSTNSPLIGKNVKIQYDGQNTNVITNREGKGFVVFNYSKQSNLVFAYFSTDFETKSAKTYALIPSRIPELPFTINNLIGLLIAIAALYLILRR